MASDAENEYLLKKIDSIETRLEAHVTKIEQRLDQIVHIMQAVAALQEKESRNAESIKEIKIQLKDSVDKFDKTISRIHERLDEFDNRNGQTKESNITKIKEIETEIAQVEIKVDRWMNRGIGLWIGISVLVVVLQTVGGLVLSSFKDEYQQTKNQIVEITKRQNETEQDIARIGANIRQLHDKR